VCIWSAPILNWSGCACLVSPNAISGFQRRDRTGRGIQDRRIGFLQSLPADNRVQVNAIWGPVFDTAPTSWGLHGNPNGSEDPQRYVSNNAFHDLLTSATLNRANTSSDSVAGMHPASSPGPRLYTALIHLGLSELLMAADN
jgi:hypothetical protein